MTLLDIAREYLIYCDSVCATCIALMINEYLRLWHDPSNYLLLSKTFLVCLKDVTKTGYFTRLTVDL